MKLTRRQETFMRQFLDLYRETREPIHYSVLAERLGVSRFTAYDMLRLLEDKGFVSSDYQLTADKAGPGRSEVVFAPTPLAHSLVAELAGNIEDENWQAIRERVLDKLRAGQGAYGEFEQEMLARIPPASRSQDALNYCVEVMTIIALRLQHAADRKLLLDYLPQLLPGKDKACRASLSLLGGFALGILAGEIAGDPEWRRELFEHMRRYQALVAAMDARQCRRLAHRLGELFAPGKSTQGTS